MRPVLNWTPPPGKQGTTLSTNAQALCTYYWTKKTGTTYQFYRPDLGSSAALASGCTNTESAYAGRLVAIYARNNNDVLTFTYSWDNGNAGSGGKVSQIVVTAESGLSATLAFADFGSYRLLSTLTRPDQTTVVYNYDAYGDLITAHQPPNNSAGTTPTETYSYGVTGPGFHYLYTLSPPRWNADDSASSHLEFGFNFGATPATTTLSWIQHSGYVNIAPRDNLNGQALQPGVSTPYTFLIEYYTIGSTATYRDTNGHMTNWITDSSGRPTQTQECVASTSQGQQCTNNKFLVTNESWDAANDLVSETDPRGYTTNYAYDANGNTTAVVEPIIGTGAQPMKLFSYDSHDNVTAYCDEVASQGLSVNWAGPPSDSFCPSTSIASRFAYAYPAQEPYGELISATTPGTPAASSGYKTTYAYAVGNQGGTDYGLPTQATGTAIAQSIDSSTPSRTPTKTFWYDGNGNIACYSSGLGQWVLQYDTMGRLTSEADPDDSGAGPGICSKTQFQSGWTTALKSTYYPDGSLEERQTASQVQNNVGTTYTYDLDGDETTEVHHYGCPTVASCQPGTTSKYYDGLDRLVEVQQPYDAFDIQAYPWSTRYIYDLSMGGTTPYQGTSLMGYGNLVKTQEFLSGTVWTPVVGTRYPSSSGSWVDTRATAFDALDRGTAAYEAAFGSTPKELDTYDAPGEAGLQSSITRASGEVKTFSAYDAMGRPTSITYAYDGGATPATQYAYDYDGRQTSRTTSVLGTETLTYDALGHTLSLTEPASLGGGLLQYDYYADGLRQDVRYKDATNNYAPLVSYAYRGDGKREELMLNNGTSFGWRYTSGGRELSQTDPLTGTSIAPTNGALIGKSPVPRLYYQSPLTYVAKTFGHDNYGRTNALTFPEGVFSYAYSDDLEDGVYSATTTASQVYDNVGPLPLCLMSNVRNEKVDPASLPASGANGCVPPSSSLLPTDLNGTNLGGLPWTVDARSGMLLNYQSVPWSDGNVNSSIYSYDASGRLTQDAETKERSATASDPPALNGAGRFYLTGTRTKTYDAENRLRSETYPWSNFNSPTSEPYGIASFGGYWEDDGTPYPYGHYDPATLQAVDYGADNHPKRFTKVQQGLPSSTTTSEVWIWDGDDRLLSCTIVSGACSLDLTTEGLLDDPLGTNDASTLWITDRNIAGVEVTAHNSVLFQTWNEAGRPERIYPYNQVGLCSEYNPSDPSTAGFGDCRRPHEGHFTADGWAVDNDSWQGVRTFDASVGQWNTPDTYAGDVQDPMTQKPFMWNRSDPYAYSDPSGFDSIYLVARSALQVRGSDLGFAHLYILVVHDPDPETGKAPPPTRYSFGPARKGLAALNSDLIQESNDYDASGDQNNYGTTLLGKCTSECTLQHGGFDEASLNRSAAMIPNQHNAYGFPFPNSNSAAYTLCVLGGGGFACDRPNTGGHVAPGLGTNLSPDAPSGPPQITTCRAGREDRQMTEFFLSKRRRARVGG